MQMQQMQFMMQTQTHRVATALPSTPSTTAVASTLTTSIPHPASSSSSSKLAIPAVSLDDFGARYKLSAIDISRLKRLGYKPGSSHITKVQECHWGAEGVNFSVIGWMEVLDVHEQFLRDVKNGLW